tara:strand:+ start:638 stop:823 length:186 start_codon:yes stop_codon:yes gene_type:complete
MIIKVTYNKSTQDLQISNDIGNVLVNSNTIIDNSDFLNFEIAVDTTEYEQVNSLENTQEIE